MYLISSSFNEGAFQGGYLLWIARDRLRDKWPYLSGSPNLYILSKCYVYPRPLSTHHRWTRHPSQKPDTFSALVCFRKSIICSESSLTKEKKKKVSTVLANKNLVLKYSYMDRNTYRCRFKKRKKKRKMERTKVTS